jgi:transposase-like protein
MTKSFVGLNELFKGRHFEREIIILCVRWYSRFKLSFRDLVELMAERGLSLAHTTIMRWVQGFAPEFERRWNRFGRQSGDSWRVDETYIVSVSQRPRFPIRWVRCLSASNSTAKVR